jgi:apolipoprotein N-acyltransferase
VNISGLTMPFFARLKINFFSQSTSLRQLLLIMLFAGLLSLAFLNHAYYFVSWFAFVPLLFAVEKTTLAKTYLLGLIAGFALFAIGTYWIVDFIMLSKGYSSSKSVLLACIYWLYCAHLIVFLVIVFKSLKKHSKIHEFVLFPLVVVIFTSSYPMLFSMRLGDTQIQFYAALQAIDLVGVDGLDGIIALVNVMIFRCLANRQIDPSLRLFKKLPWGLALSVVCIWFIYGGIAHSSWEKNVSSWSVLKVGLVQPNEIPKIGKRVLYPGYGQVYPPEMEMTQRLSTLGADIIVWPEAQRKGFLDNSHIRTAYQNSVQSMDMGLLFQDTQQLRDPLSGKLQHQYNTAVMLNDDGKQIGSYQKMKRIPFGEYIPFVNDDSQLKKWLDAFWGDFVNVLKKGDHHQVFVHSKVNIIPLICYETTFPSFVGQAVSEATAKINPSLGTLLVALSNDGWFGSTHQPYQHIMVSALRAVENRLPFVHAVNNGPSIVVLPSGKIIFTSDFQQAGGYLVDVPVSNKAGGSFYSRHANLFIYALYISLAFIVCWVLLQWFVLRVLSNQNTN